MSKEFDWEFDFGETEQAKEYDKDWNQFKSEKYIGLVVTDNMEVQGVYKDMEFVYAIAKNQISKSKNGQWWMINKGTFKENPIFVRHYLAVEAFNGGAEIVIFKSRDERCDGLFVRLKDYFDVKTEQDKIKIKRKQ